jgi:hypothetical protein
MRVGVPSSSTSSPERYALHCAERPLERCHVDGLAPELRERGVAATNAQHRPSAALSLQRRGRRGRHGRMAGRRIRDAGAEQDPLSRRGCERQLDPDVGVQALAVRHHHAVVAELLAAPGEWRYLSAEGECVTPELDGGKLTRRASELASRPEDR